MNIDKNTITRDEVLEIFRGALIAHNDKLTGPQLTEEARITPDLGLDSLDCIEVMLDVESLLDIEIPDEHFENFQAETTIGQVADMAFSVIENNRSLTGGTK